MGFTEGLKAKTPDMRSKKIKKVHIAAVGGEAPGSEGFRREQKTILRRAIM
jgi:hypothetical protein